MSSKSSLGEADHGERLLRNSDLTLLMNQAPTNNGLLKLSVQQAFSEALKGCQAPKSPRG